MGSCYSGDHSLETTCTQTYYNVTLRKHNRSTASERSVKEYCFGRGGGGGVRGQTLPSTSAVVQNSQFSNKGQVQIVN